MVGDGANHSGRKTCSHYPVVTGHEVGEKSRDREIDVATVGDCLWLGASGAAAESWGSCSTGQPEARVGLGRAEA